MKVLLATDGSLAADLAGQLLVKLPLAHPRVTAAMVIQPMAVVASPFYPVEAYLADNERIQGEIADRTLDAVCTRLAQSGVHCEPQVLRGDPATELLASVEHHAYDLVAAGSNTEGPLEALFMGSVCRKLVLYSGASVLIARHYLSDDSSHRIESKANLDAVLAVDGSDGSNVAVDALANMEGPRFGRLTIVSVSRFSDEATGSRGVADRTAAKELVDSTAEILARCASEVRATVAHGRPSEGIIEVAAKEDADLVILGATRHGAIERMFLGSCAYEVATRAHCAVLVVRNSLALS